MKKTKRFLAAAMILFAATSFVFTSCDPEVPEDENKTEQTGGETTENETSGESTDSKDETSSAKEYTVTFDKADGSETPKTTAKVKDGEKAEKPADPAKTGYTFAGWFAKDAAEAFDFESTITADTTLTAKWTVVEYTITYKLAKGETNSDKNPTKYTIESEDITLSAPTGTTEKPNFVAWHKDKADGETVTSIKKGSTGNLTLVAEFTDKTTFKVTYYNGIEELDSVSVVEGGAVENKTIAVEGYDFVGWYSDAALTTAFDFTKPITAATSVYGKYVKSEIKINLIPENDTKPYVIQKSDGEYAEIKGVGKDDTKYLKDDKIVITVKGKADKDITGMKFVFVDCAADTAFGGESTYGYNIMGEGVVEEETTVIPANTDFEKSLTLTLTADQIGTGKDAHRVRIYCTGKETIKIYPQGTDTVAKLEADIEAEQAAVEEAAREKSLITTPQDLSWSSLVSIEGSKFIDLAAGKAIKITVTGTAGEEVNLKLMGKDWNPKYNAGKVSGCTWGKDTEWKLTTTFGNDGIAVFIYEPSAGDILQIKNSGFGIQGGEDGKVTKVQIVDAPTDGVEHAADDTPTPPASGDENVIFEGSQELDWANESKRVNVSKDSLALMTSESILVFEVEIVEGGDCVIQIQDGGWSGVLSEGSLENAIADTGNTFKVTESGTAKYKPSQSELELIKEKGFVAFGQGTIKKISIE